MGLKGCANSHSSFRGFTLLEVLVALFFVGAAVVLVAGLGQQVISLSKRSSQTGAILELRNMTTSISRNADNWLNAMRSSQHTQGIFAGCIPDPKSNVTTFTCPATEASHFDDKDLKEISENGTFHIVSAPLVNNSGDLIAGSEAVPVYYTSEGRICDKPNKASCELKSTGYFMRSNSRTDQDPGNIKFVIKVERNVANAASATTPMKPQYITMDIGASWKDVSANFSGSCPANTIKIGYLSNGKPSCVNPSKPCADSSQVPIGINPDGSTLCKSLPDCTSSGGHVVLNQSGSDLICSNASPCGANKLFLGYFAGSGEPMCSSSSMKCASGQVQTGISIASGEMKAECETLPSCADANMRLSFNGAKFVCESAVVVMTCANDEVMTGIKADGSPNCTQRAPASTVQKCPDGQVVDGLDAKGEITCRAAAASSGPQSCANARYDSGWVSISEGSQKTFQHNLGSEDTLVDIESRDDTSNHTWNGATFEAGKGTNFPQSNSWIFYSNKTANSISVYRHGGTFPTKQVRVHMVRTDCASSTGSNQKFVSQEFSISDFLSDGKIEVAHGFASAPSMVNWVLVNKVAEHGYQPGDEIPQSEFGGGRTILSNATHLKIFSGISNNCGYYNPIQWTAKNSIAMYICTSSSGGGGTKADNSKWRLKVYALP